MSQIKMTMNPSDNESIKNVKYFKTFPRETLNLHQKNNFSAYLQFQYLSKIQS